MQIAHSFGHKTWRLPDDVVSRGEQSTREGREEMMTGKGTSAGTGSRTRTGMSTRAGVGARTGAGKGTRVDRRVEGREGMGTFEVVSGNRGGS